MDPEVAMNATRGKENLKGPVLIHLRNRIKILQKLIIRHQPFKGCGSKKQYQNIKKDFKSQAEIFMIPEDDYLICCSLYHQVRHHHKVAFVGRLESKVEILEKHYATLFPNHPVQWFRPVL
jgi:hypothetical protein